MVKDFEACPGEAEITAIGTSCKCISVPQVCRASWSRMWGRRRPRPSAPTVRSTRATQSHAALVNDDVATRFVVFAER